MIVVLAVAVAFAAGALTGWTLCALYGRAVGDQRRGGYIR